MFHRFHRRCYATDDDSVYNPIYDGRNNTRSVQTTFNCVTKLMSDIKPRYPAESIAEIDSEEMGVFF